MLKFAIGIQLLLFVLIAIVPLLEIDVDSKVPVIAIYLIFRNDLEFIDFTCICVIGFKVLKFKFVIITVLIV